MKQVGHELGVRYVLEGSLRKSGNRIRATAQLVEADTGRHVWAERYDRDLADIFALEDEITEAVTIAVAPAIAEIEQQRAMRRPPDNLDTWAAYERGLWHFCKMSAADNALAQKFFQQAIDCGPTFGGGYKGVAMAMLQGTTAFQTRRPPRYRACPRNWPAGCGARRGRCGSAFVSRLGVVEARRLRRRSGRGGTGVGNGAQFSLCAWGARQRAHVLGPAEGWSRVT